MSIDKAENLGYQELLITLFQYFLGFWLKSSFKNKK